MNLCFILSKKEISFLYSFLIVCFTRWCWCWKAPWETIKYFPLQYIYIFGCVQILSLSPHCKQCCQLHFFHQQGTHLNSANSSLLMKGLIIAKKLVGNTERAVLSLLLLRSLSWCFHEQIRDESYSRDFQMKGGFC